MLAVVVDKVKRKWKLFALIGVTVVLAGFVGWYLLGSKNNVTAEAVTVPVRKGSIEVTVSGTGSVQPIVARSIAANVSGTIARINFRNGQQVKQGDLLFELKNENLEAEVKRATLNLKQAELEYSMKLDERKQQNVYAPMSGQVTQVDIDTGKDVQKNAVLMVITDTSRLIFKVPVNGAQVGYIQAGQKVDVTIPALMSTLQGRVRKVDRGGIAGTDGSKMYNVSIEVSNPGALSPGLEAQAAIHTSSGIQAGYEGGTLEWAETATVRAGVSGNIKQLLVDENALVTKGQKLAYIESDTIDTQLVSQELKLEQARLSLNDAQKNLADCQIYAPVDGIITLSTSSASNSGGSKTNSSGTATASSGTETWQVGDQVSAGQTLATIVGMAGMKVNVSVDEVDITKVELEQKATITIDALPDQKFAGTVTEIAAKGTEQNGVATFDVTVNIDKPGSLKENMTANVEILVAKKDDVLLLPVEAVQERQGRKFVLVAAGNNISQPNRNTEEAGFGSGKAGGETRGTNQWSRTVPVETGGAAQSFRMVTVETGLYNDTMIEITSGLQEGDIVRLPSAASNRGTGTGSTRTPGGVFSGGGMFGGGRPPGDMPRRY